MIKISFRKDINEVEGREQQPNMDPRHEELMQRLSALEQRDVAISEEQEELRARLQKLDDERAKTRNEINEIKGLISDPKSGDTKPQPAVGLPGTEPNPAEPKEKKEKKSRFGKVIGAVALAAAVVVTAFSLKACDDDNKSEKLGTGNVVPTKTIYPDINPTATTDPGTSTTATTAKSLKKISYKELVGKYGKQDRGNNAEHLIGDINVDPNNEKASYNRFIREINQNPEALAHLNTCINANGSFNTDCASPENIKKANVRLAEYKKMPLAERAYIAKSLANKFDQHIQYNGIITHNGAYNTFGISEDGKRIFAMQNTRYNDYWMSFTDKNGKKFYVRDCAQVVTPIKATYKKPVVTPTKPTPTTPTVSKPKPTPKPTPVQSVGGKPTPVTPKPEKKPVQPKPQEPKKEKPTCKTNPEMEGCKPKVDTNTTPAGVPGQNRGSGTTDSGPTGPGVGPAEQPVRPDGTVGGEKLPTAPAPEVTKPAPLPEQPSAPVQPGEQTGQPTEAPAEPATDNA
ncbi:MAG: hypothetical protein E6Q39_02520 [Crocinitomicaceae bacterium]|nr:MAG: hypothetical protein E6Q39_02520 [Crocinitomicaceae bacterium]